MTSSSRSTTPRTPPNRHRRLHASALEQLPAPPRFARRCHAARPCPARSHYLFVNAAAGVPERRPRQPDYGTGITDDGGVALALPDTTIVDQAA
jgi:hypothetical protein